VCRLLSANQLAKLKSDTLELERKLQAKREESLEDAIMSLKMEDRDSKAALRRSSSVSVMRGLHDFGRESDDFVPFANCSRLDTLLEGKPK
jgi:hypothetical protein